MEELFSLMLTCSEMDHFRFPARETEETCQNFQGGEGSSQHKHYWARLGWFLRIEDIQEHLDEFRRHPTAWFCSHGSNGILVEGTVYRSPVMLYGAEARVPKTLFAMLRRDLAEVARRRKLVRQPHQGRLGSIRRLAHGGE